MQTQFIPFTSVVFYKYLENSKGMFSYLWYDMSRYYIECLQMGVGEDASKIL